MTTNIMCSSLVWPDPILHRRKGTRMCQKRDLSLSL